MKTNVQLTPREREIAEMLAWGASKKEIADLIGRTYRTVDNITRNIFMKVGVHCSRQLAAWWFCTTYNISHELSPLRRALTCAVLLFSFIWQITALDYNIERARYRAGRRSRRDDLELTVNLES